MRWTGAGVNMIWTSLHSPSLLVRQHPTLLSPTLDKSTATDGVATIESQNNITVASNTRPCEPRPFQ